MIPGENDDADYILLWLLLLLLLILTELLLTLSTRLGFLSSSTREFDATEKDSCSDCENEEGDMTDIDF